MAGAPRPAHPTEQAKGIKEWVKGPEKILLELSFNP